MAVEASSLADATPMQWEDVTHAAASRMVASGDATMASSLASTVALALDGAAFHAGHDVIRRGHAAVVRDLAGIEQCQDVGMLQLGGDADLEEEARGRQAGGEFVPQDLERHLSVMPNVAGPRLSAPGSG